MPAGRRELRLATSQAGPCCPVCLPSTFPLPSPGKCLPQVSPVPGGCWRGGGPGCGQGLRLLFMSSPPPLQPDSCSLFQQVPVISGVITGVRFGAAKRGFWRGGGGREQRGDGEGPGKDEAGWALVGFRCHFAWDLPCSVLRCRSSPSPHAVRCQLPVSGSAASPSQPYAAPAETRIIHLR